MRHPSRLLVLILSALALPAALPGCAATRMEGVSSFPEAVRLYRMSDDQKAMAVAADARGRRAWGVVFEYAREESAVEKALEECRANAAAARVDAPCFLFAVNDAQAESTVRACAEGRIGGQRCGLQSKYGW